MSLSYGVVNFPDLKRHYARGIEIITKILLSSGRTLDLRKRLKIEIESLIKKYFPGTSLVHNYEGNAPKNSYQ
jgi:hypothetical protein